MLLSALPLVRRHMGASINIETYNYKHKFPVSLQSSTQYPRNPNHTPPESSTCYLLFRSPTHFTILCPPSKNSHLLLRLTSKASGNFWSLTASASTLASLFFTDTFCSRMNQSWFIRPSLHPCPSRQCISQLERRKLLLACVFRAFEYEEDSAPKDIPPEFLEELAQYLTENGLEKQIALSRLNLQHPKLMEHCEDGMSHVCEITYDDISHREATEWKFDAQNGFVVPVITRGCARTSSGDHKRK